MFCLTQLLLLGYTSMEYSLTFQLRLNLFFRLSRSNIITSHGLQGLFFIKLKLFIVIYQKALNHQLQKRIDTCTGRVSVGILMGLLCQWTFCLCVFTPCRIQ